VRLFKLHPGHLEVTGEQCVGCYVNGSVRKRQKMAIALGCLESGLITAGFSPNHDELNRLFGVIYWQPLKEEGDDIRFPAGNTKEMK
jgi:hypothetical protein